MKGRVARVGHGFKFPEMTFGTMLLSATAATVIGAGGLTIASMADGWLAPVGAGIAMAAAIPACAALSMAAYGIIGRRRLRDLMIESIDWRGNEFVLDIGTGDGLLLIAAAKKLGRRGRATGTGLWHADDNDSGDGDAALNRLAETVAREGVEDQVALRAEDPDQLSFRDATFDIVLSLAGLPAFHGPAGHPTALLEMVRVVKPGGRLIIAGHRPVQREVALLRKAGLIIRSCRARPMTALTPIWLIDAQRLVSTDVVCGQSPVIQSTEMAHAAA